MTPAEGAAGRRISQCGTPGEHTGPVRLYPAGWRCASHTPAATAGQPEPPTTPNGETR